MDNRIVPESGTSAVPGGFDYSALDFETLTALRECEAQIRQVLTRSATELGRRFCTAQQLLADHYQGMFEAWYTEMGYKRQTVYNLIQRYLFVEQCQRNRSIYSESAASSQHVFNNISPNSENTIEATEFPEPSTIPVGEPNDTIVERFEALPLTLSYEISSPGAPPELVEKALNGEIKTLAEYRRQLKASRSPSGWLELAGGNLPKIGSARAGKKLADAYKSQCEAIAETLKYSMTGIPIEEFEPVLWEAIYAARDAAKVLEQTLTIMKDDIKGGINF